MTPWPHTPCFSPAKKGPKRTQKDTKTSARLSRKCLQETRRNKRWDEFWLLCQKNQSCQRRAVPRRGLIVYFWIKRHRLEVQIQEQIYRKSAFLITKRERKHGSTRGWFHWNQRILNRIFNRVQRCYWLVLCGSSVLKFCSIKHEEVHCVAPNMVKIHTSCQETKASYGLETSWKTKSRNVETFEGIKVPLRIHQWCSLQD